MSLSDYLLHEISQAAERPTTEQLRERLRRYPPITLPLAPADVVRADVIREERDRH